jgi:hypothetical protein
MGVTRPNREHVIRFRMNDVDFDSVLFEVKVRHLEMKTKPHRVTISETDTGYQVTMYVEAPR